MDWIRRLLERVCRSRWALSDERSGLERYCPLVVVTTNCEYAQLRDVASWDWGGRSSYNEEQQMRVDKGLTPQELDSVTARGDGAWREHQQNAGKMPVSVQETGWRRIDGIQYCLILYGDDFAA